MRLIPLHRPSLALTCGLGAVFAAVAWLLPSSAHADDAPPAATLTTTSNVALVSQYKFRGIDQTWGRPAIQGGVDLVAADGLYAGAWVGGLSLANGEARAVNPAAFIVQAVRTF